MTVMTKMREFTEMTEMLKMKEFTEMTEMLKMTKVDGNQQLFDF